MNTTNKRRFGHKRAMAVNCECDYNFTCRACLDASTIGTQPLQGTHMKTQQTEHDCDKCGEHFSTCICTDTPAQAHSPLPWTLGHELGDGFSIVHEVAPNCGILSVIANAQYSGGVNYQPDRYEAKANAAFIVRACNEYEQGIRFLAEAHIKRANAEAHAQRLADALSMACRVIEGENLDEAMAGEYEILTDAIAQWEGSKQ